MSAEVERLLAKRAHPFAGAPPSRVMVALLAKHEQPLRSHRHAAQADIASRFSLVMAALS